MTVPHKEKGQEAIQYFTKTPYKPKKNEPEGYGIGLANTVSYLKAKEQIAKWAKQYGIDPSKAGVPLLRYADPDTLEYEPVTAARAKTNFIKYKDYRGTDAPKDEKKKAEIIEKVPLTPRQKTEKLKADLATAAASKAELIGNIKSGDVSTNVPGISKKHKGFLDRNVGQYLGGFWHEANTSAPGDWTKKLLDWLDRPSNAVEGALSGIAAGVDAPPTVAEVKRQQGGHITPEEEANAQRIRDDWEKIHNTSIWSRTRRGFQGKEDYNLDNFFENLERQESGYGKQGFMENLSWRGGSMMAGGILDPANVVVGPKVVTRGVKIAKDLSKVGKGVHTAERVAEAVEDVSKVAKAGTVVRDTEDVISGAKTAGHVFEAEKTVREAARTIPAPRELPQFAESLVKTPAERRVMQNASETGYKSLVTETKSAARNLARAQELHKAGKITTGQLTQLAEVHADLLRDIERADEFRRTGQIAGPVNKVGGSFEFGGETQAARRAAELTAEAEKAAKITDATNQGYRTLEVATRKAAKERALAERLVRTGKITEEEVAAKVAAHDALLSRYNEASKFRSVAEVLPVGGKLSELEQDVKRLEGLVEKAPENKLLGARLTKATKAVQAARLAEIPHNSERIASAARKLAAGKDITKAEVEAVTHASAEIQDQLIATAKAAEAMPGKASVVDQVLAGAPKAPTAPLISDAAELPSTRMMQAIHEATQRAMKVMPSEGTLDEAADIAIDVTSDNYVRKVAAEMMDEMKTANRKWSRGTITSMAAHHGVQLGETDEVLEAAAELTGKKIANARKLDPLAVPATRAQEMFDESVLELINPTVKKLTEILEEGTRKRFAIPFFHKDLGEFEPIGRMLTKAYAPFELVGKHAGAGSRSFSKAFRIGAHFEGETNFIRQMAEASGTVEHKRWAGRVRDGFKGISRAEAKQITHAMEDGTTFADPRMQGYLDTAIGMRNEIFDNLTKLGKYVPAEKVEGYVYHFYHSRNKTAIKAMHSGRLSDLKAGLKGPTLETAAKKGLKPEMDIDKIMMMHHRDYVSELQRINYRQQVMSQFGVLLDNGHLANGLGLQEVSVKKLNKAFQAEAKVKNAKYYLPPEIHETFKAMDDMMGIGWNPEADGFMRGFDKVVRTYKTMATIGNPGNWINNTVGDFFLNWVDNVHNPKWYSQSMRALIGGENAPRTIAMAGEQLQTNVLLRDFRNKAPSGGFISTEGSGPLSRARGRVTGIPTRAGKRIQGVYESREEWVRFAHFLSATDEEARKLIRAGKGANFEAVRETATELAAKRVAKWNIDYSELTPFERQLRKRYIPFYTFMRKATPLMLEGMITRPGKLNHYSRAKKSLEQFMGIFPEEDDGTTWPDWTKEQGITRLTQEDEPLYLREMSPLNVINRLTGGDSVTSPIMNMLNQTSPLIKMPLEVGMRKTLYNDRAITNWPEFWLNQVPAISIGARIAGYPLSPQKTAGQVDKSAGTAIIERLSAFGIPIGRNTEARQQSQLYKDISKVGNTLKKVNAGLEPLGYEIKKTSTTKNGTYYLLKGPDGETIDRYRDWNDALRAIQS